MKKSSTHSAASVGREDAEMGAGGGNAGGVPRAEEHLDGLVKSSARTLDILELVAEHGDGLLLTDFRQRLGIPVSSLHGLLSTMVQRGYLTREDASGLYRLGPMTLRLVAAYESHIDLVAMADPIMDEIRGLTQETTSLTVLHRDFIVFIHKRAVDGAVQVVNPIGTVLPAHATGSGKVMLALLSEHELDQLYPREELQRLTPNTILTRADLNRELARVRRQGYAFDDEESAVGVWAVAACIRNAQGHPVAALSIVAPVFHVQNQDTRAWPSYVIESAAKISASLGFRM